MTYECRNRATYLLLAGTPTPASHHPTTLRADMSERPIHKRSKSARVLNLIRGEESRQQEPELGNPLPTTHSSSDVSFAASSTIQPTPSTRPVLTDTMSSSGIGQSLEQTSTNRTLDVAEKVSPSGLHSNSTSIQDSVRTFRVFEVLRSGDTPAILKAIHESKASSGSPHALGGTTILHLAIQCAEPQVVDFVISNGEDIDINALDREGNTPLHQAAQLGRFPIVKQLLEQPQINDAIPNHQGRTAIDLARTPEIFQQLQLARSIFVDQKIREAHMLVAQNDYKKLEELLIEPRVEGCLDVNALELATDQITIQGGGTLLHEAARKKDIQLAQVLLMHGADPFRRDRKGRLPQDVTKDDRTRGILKKSPAAAVAQRGIQEKAILGSTPGQTRSPTSGISEGSKDAREMKGYLKKWTNYTSGYKLRWFVLEDGVLSYYKHQGMSLLTSTTIPLLIRD
jgi:oxysterol-binding protein 1